MKTLAAVAVVTLWFGRALAVAFFLVWGAFFLEHLGWFVHPAQGVPPGRVWVLQLIHLTFLAGLLVILKWEALGSALTIVAALAFFASVAGQRFPLFFAVTSLPVVLIVLGRLLSHYASEASHAH
jgi:hypothetical protein